MAACIVATQMTLLQIPRTPSPIKTIVLIGAAESSGFPKPMTTSEPRFSLGSSEGLQRRTEALRKVAVLRQRPSEVVESREREAAEPPQSIKDEQTGQEMESIYPQAPQRFPPAFASPPLDSSFLYTALTSFDPT